jgi:hypothetical protein
MNKRFMLIILGGMIVGLILGREASAGCIPLSNGGQYCAAWITGSEICSGTAKGIKKICTNPNDPSTCLGEVLCQAGGTIPTSFTPDASRCNDTNNIFPTANDFCGISGILFCINGGGNASKAQGQPFTFDGVLTGATNTSSCDKNGKCTFTNVELIPDLSQAQCINTNWTAVDFTAGEFKAKSCFCSGTYDLTTDPPTCYADSFSPSLGTQTCLIQSCSVSLTGIKINDTRAYTCTGQLPPP